jgi:flagellar protein FliS
MLMEGALDKMAAAKGHMLRNELADKGRFISWAISIISGLQSSLDMDAGGELSRNLDDLYDYMVRRLGEAGAKNDPTILDEVSSLLLEVKSAWDVIPTQLDTENRQSAV